MAKAERLQAGARQIRDRTLISAIDILIATGRVAETVSKHKKIILFSAGTAFATSLYGVYETGKAIGQEIPFAVQEPDFTSRQLLYAEKELDSRNAVVVFNSKWILLGKKKPDPESALKNLKEKSRGFVGLPEVEQNVNEVIGELAEGKAEENSSHGSQIEKLETARQLILTSSTYREKLNELEQKMFIFCAGILSSLVFLSFSAVDKFKNNGSKSAQC